MADSDTEVTEADVIEHLRAGLADFPQIASAVPGGFPGNPSFGITKARMQQYSDTRQNRYWHQVNLPLVLHAYQDPKEPRVRELMKSLLQALNDFLGRFEKLPGTRSLLAPLWEDLWTETPQLWSIASCAFMALKFDAAHIEVIGFERPVGGGPQDSDILVRLSGKTTHVDIEAFHRADFGDLSDDAIVQSLQQRADTKAGKKFANLPADEDGVIAEVCVVSGQDVHRSLALPQPRQLKGRPENVFWMTCRLVGVALPGGLAFTVLPL